MSADYARLRLKYHGDPVRMDEILQAECREKTAKKLPRLLGCADFRFPSLAVAEMSTSEAAADYHASLVKPGCTVLDMTAGLGVDAFAMARKGCHVTAVEIEPHTAEVLRHNVKALDLDDAVEVVEANSVEWLMDSDRKFDVIFIDPARRDNTGRHFTLKDCHPDVLKHIELLTLKCDLLVIKASPMINVGELNEYGAETSVVGTTRECKEVLFCLGAGCQAGRVRCVTLGHGEFVVREGVTQKFGTPLPGDILFQPYPAVMKGGGTASIDNAVKLHPFSHLFFAESVPADFPGEAYRIVAIHPFDKRNVKTVATEYPKINVAVRNFPLSAPELVKRLKVKEGGRMMLFGTTSHDGAKLLIVADPITNNNA